LQSTGNGRNLRVNAPLTSQSLHSLATLRSLCADWQTVSRVIGMGSTRRG
jgi:hypothetical protein